VLNRGRQTYPVMLHLFPHRAHRSGERKLDTRRKIVVGAAVMAYAELDPSFADRLQEILDVGVTRPVDRAAILDLLPSPSSSVAAA
jgi:hypothetical protein